MLVGLLRGVNVGGNNKLPMAPLRAALAAAGLVDVSSYLQSGNVIADHPDPVEFGRIVRETIAAGFGLDIPVVVRSGTQLHDVLEWNPFPDAVEASPKLVHVSFLAEAPPPEVVERLTALEPGADRWALRGSELTVAYASSSHDSPFGRSVARVFGVGITARNWSTVRALAELAGP
jgi:uncharacterized protein (DUF1697 family)